MIRELSILIPVYNDLALPLVKALQGQASCIEGLVYEILAVDDGSSDKAVIIRNKAINDLPHCSYIMDRHHDCRSAMRNALFRHGRFEWQLMVDARLTIVRDDFLRCYLSQDIKPGEAACGGVGVDGGIQSAVLYRQNLRYRYEKYEESAHSVCERNRHPYRSFRTTNFFFHRSVLERCPYDETIKGYGYEDVILGKTLEEKGIRVHHIDNPVVYTSFEDNRVYLKKIDEALSTLYALREALRAYSPVLDCVNQLRRFHLLRIVKTVHHIIVRMERSNLEGKHPSLLLFKLYKLGQLARMFR